MSINRSSDKNPVVLLVDDDPDQLMLLQMLLEDENVDVITSQSAREGLEIVKGRPVDIVVSDVAMPGMTGIELARGIRSMKDKGSMPVLLISAGKEHIDFHSIDFRADGFFLKKSLKSTLVPKLRELVSE